MTKTIIARFRRHWDILIPLVSAIFGAGVIYSQNSEAIASLTIRQDKMETKIEGINEVKQDVSAIKQKVDDIWDIMKRHK